MEGRVLIVAAAPYVDADAEFLKRLATDASFVAGVDGGAGRCLDAGIVPDVVIGDLDSLDLSHARALRERGVPFEIAPADKDVTDLDLTLDHVAALGATDIVLTGCVSGRLDHTLAVIGSLAHHAGLRPVVAEPSLDGWILADRYRDKVRIVDAGATFSVIPVLGEAVVSVSGARWPLEHARLAGLGSRGVSNVALAEGAAVQIHAGRALVLRVREV